MTKRDDADRPGQDTGKIAAFTARPAEELPYVVELWTLARDAPERVIGRASGMVVARAIFTAAQSEHLGRRIVLRRGERVVAEAG